MPSTLSRFPATVIAPATEAHLPGIITVFNDIVATSTAVYTEQPDNLEQRQQWFAQRRAMGYPVLVALGAEENEVLGFASFADFRPSWPGFRHTVEHSVHIRADARGRGLGPLLVSRLIAEAVMRRKHAMVASVDAENHRSIAMHESLGFERAALMPQVGCKFGRWLDLVLMVKLISDGPPH
ncbi:GNAT family N-acetyltransferase [Roseomonas sp. KE0001]|uniref:GNAT family N-acetyltransferase n=1 Tax=Roseomonas sp. KE0001 TaxID=2479201 RepID=UPI0018DF7C54|nr:GNAT family N-acetyltransferase [Roseomonas sp. KE0001]MBI0434207.1 N-acetyltransferase family protein [Roseomonas sp. KE0001]